MSPQVVYIGYGPPYCTIYITYNTYPCIYNECTCSKAEEVHGPQGSPQTFILICTHTFEPLWNYYIWYIIIYDSYIGAGLGLAFGLNLQALVVTYKPHMYSMLVIITYNYYNIIIVYNIADYVYIVLLIIITLHAKHMISSLHMNHSWLHYFVIHQPNWSLN